MEQGGARRSRPLVNVKPAWMGTRFLLRGEWPRGSVPVSPAGFLGTCVPVRGRSSRDYLQLIKTAPCVFVASTFSPVLFHSHVQASGRPHVLRPAQAPYWSL